MPRAIRLPIGAGIHTLVVQEWVDLVAKVNADGKGGNPYTDLKVLLDNETEPRHISIFDSGLELFIDGVKKQLGIPKNETDSNLVLDAMVGKKVLANHYSNTVTNKVTNETRIFWNWGWNPDKFVSAPSSSTTTTTTEPDEDDAPLPDLG